MSNWGVLYWPFFLILVSALFLVPEVYALITNSANTLSDYCWNQLSVHVAFGSGRHTLAWWLSQGAFIIFFVLITIHIWYRSV
jgi:hypothetical protein